MGRFLSILVALTIFASLAHAQAEVTCPAPEDRPTTCGSSGVDPELYSLLTNFSTPSYFSSVDLSLTMFCYRAYVDTCSGDDTASFRIPNLMDHEVTCQDTPSWEWYAVPLPRHISNIDSYLDVQLDKGNTASNGFGFAFSHAYLTEVEFGDIESENTNLDDFRAVRDDTTFQLNPYFDEEEEEGRFLLPIGCDIEEDYVEVLVDFWQSDCVNLDWQSEPIISPWNIQTPDSSCYCVPDEGSYSYDPENNIVHGVSNIPQFYWWFGECDIDADASCHVDEEVYLPFTTFDSDLDGVPDNCDRCPGFDDHRDADGDLVPNGCDLCEGEEDQIDDNRNGVPDGCELCFVHGCGAWAHCDDISPNLRECTCPPGYSFDEDDATFTSFLSSEERNDPCVDLDECDLYGCSDDSTCIQSTTPNYRNCVCDDGLFGDRRLEGSETFDGCLEIENECTQYGCGDFALCTLGDDAVTRVCTCFDGFEAVGDEELEGNEEFGGCADIDECDSGDDNCGENSHCINFLGTFSCVCPLGWIDANGDGTTCVDPCSINNGGCEDECISPSAEGSEYECACNDPNAALVGGTNCECRSPFFGDGLVCVAETECVFAGYVDGGIFLSSPQPLAEDAEEPLACAKYRDNSCCNLNSEFFDVGLVERLSDGECGSRLHDFACNPCSPDQDHLVALDENTVELVMCSDTCHRIYDACSEAFIVVEGDDSDEEPEFIVGDMTPTEFCESLYDTFFTNSTGVNVLINARSSDKGVCFAAGNAFAIPFALLLLLATLFFLE